MPSAPAQPPEAVPVESPAEQRWQRLRDLWFSDADHSVYVILDAASIPGLPQRLAAAPEESACLYRGELGTDLLETAPYLVKLRAEGPIARWFADEGWGKNCGILVVTTLGFEAVRRHFRGFLRVRDYTGKILYFRYYDPRVLRVYLPTCNSSDIATVFGGLKRYICEGEIPNEALEFPAHRIRITPRTMLV